MKSLLLVVMTVLIGTIGISQKANAGVPTYVGDFMVDGGHNYGESPIYQYEWDQNPQCFTGQEAAALLFGGAPSDYLISVNPNTVDPSTITDTAWTDSWGISTGQIFAQDYKLQTGTGYNDPYGGPATSAFVLDHVNDAGQNVNYVWAANADVVPPCPGAPVTPEPSSCALLLTGGLPLFGLLRRK